MSAAPDEGKTFTAINLAIAIAADKDATALLVDLDLRNPRLHKRFGFEPTAGVEDCLRGEATLADTLVSPEGYPNLCCCPPGRPVEHSSELITSASARAFFSEIKQRYANRIVIFDLPPVLGSDDALAFAPQVDSALMVVGDNLTKRDELDRSFELMREIPVMGTVLNGSRNERSAGYAYVLGSAHDVREVLRLPREAFRAHARPAFPVPRAAPPARPAAAGVRARQRGAFLLITGEVGSGKTTLIRHLLGRLDKDLTVGLISNTSRDSGRLLQWVCSAFGLDVAGKDDVALYHPFIDFVVEEYARGRRVLLIVDEAQNLGRNRLEELRVLSNVNVDKHLVLQTVLVGQPELRDMMRTPQLRQFAQRIGADYHIGR